MPRPPEPSKVARPEGRLRGFAVNAAVLLGSLLVAFFAGEVLARAVGAGGVAELGASFDRPLRYYGAEPERRSPWAAGSDDPLRIAVVGDSFTAGEGNHAYDAYPARLESLLNLNTGQRPVEVRSFAQRGSSTHVQLKFVQPIAAWKPDVLIVGIFLNDTEILEDRVMRELRLEMLPRVPAGWSARVLRSSALLGWAYQRLENRRSGQAAIDYYRYLYRPEYQGFVYFTESIEIFHNMAKKFDMQFLPVILPGLAAAGDDYPFDFAHEAIHGVLEGEGLAYLDLREAFRHTLPVRTSAFPVIDPHPSEIAQRIAADAVFHRLLDDGIIDPGYRPKQVLRKSREAWLEQVRRMQSVVFVEEGTEP